MPSFTCNMVEDILASDESSTRFENFCVFLFCDVDGIDYVPTSRSYDLGRDGRVASMTSSKEQSFILCSLTVDYAKKAEDDLKRLMEFKSPKSIIFCSSQKISEQAVDKLESTLQAICPGLDIRTMGVDQLSMLAMKHPTSFTRYYHAELSELKSALSTGDTDPSEVTLTGLRIPDVTYLPLRRYYLILAWRHQFHHLKDQCFG